MKDKFAISLTLVLAFVFSLLHVPATASTVLPTADIETCRVETKYDVDLASQPWWAETSVGFPKSKLRLPDRGTINAVLLYVQFKDAKSSGSPVKDSKQFTNYLNGYYKSVSRNAINFKFTVPNRVFTIDKNSSVYKMDKWNQGDAHTYAQDALNAADPFVDFTNIDVFYVIPPKSIKKIVYGPAFPLDAGGFRFQTDEAELASGAVGGADSRNFPDAKPGVWIARETGHLFGMPHPYSNANIAAWDLMHWDNSVPETYGWNRYVNGWIADGEVTCLDLRESQSGEITVQLEPLSRVAQGEKLVVMRVSANKVVVLENRRKTKFDKLTPNNEGVIAYEVDMAKYGGSQIKLLSRGNTINGLPLGTLRASQSVKVGKAEITVKGKSSAADTVQIKIGK